MSLPYEGRSRPAPAMFCLLAPLRGTLGVGGTAYAAGELCPYDASRPVEPDLCPPDHLLGVAVPRAMLSLPPGAVDGLTGVPIPARDGVGLLLTTMLIRLTGDPGSYRPADGPRLGSVLLDLVSAVVAHALDGESGTAARDEPAGSERPHPRLHPATPAGPHPQPGYGRRRPPHLHPVPAPALPGGRHHGRPLDPPPAPRTRPPRPRRPVAARHPDPPRRRPLGLHPRRRLHPRFPHRLRPDADGLSPPVLLRRRNPPAREARAGSPGFSRSCGPRRCSTR